MKKEVRKERFALTLLFAVIIFCVLLLSIGISVVALYILTRFGIFTAGENALDLSSTLMFLGFVSLIIGFIFAMVTSKISMKPVNHVITLMNRLASGDFKARMAFRRPLKTHSAFTEISDSFNKMAQELESTEMLRADFINNFSHEFKTPIVSIAGFAKLLRRGNLTEAQREEYLAIVEEESLRLSAMATNVLNLTKIENQAILNDVSTYNLSEQLRSCVLLLEELWVKKGIEPDLEFEEYTITANEELLRQVWINLLDNAIKFSPQGGEIWLRIHRADGAVQVSVTNFGPPIPPEKQEKIWNKFYQADESHASRGNGVGLAIVRRVAQLHGGTARVESDPGMTTFTVVLPQ